MTEKGAEEQVLAMDRLRTYKKSHPPDDSFLYH